MSSCTLQNLAVDEEDQELYRKLIKDKNLITNMDETSQPNEIILEISGSGLINKYGLGVDFGISMTKIAYAEAKGDKVQLHLLNYPKEKSEKCLLHLKELAKDYAPNGIFHATGGHWPKPKQILETLLGVRIENEFELDYAAPGFVAFTSLLPPEDTFYSKPKSVDDLANKDAIYEMCCLDDTLGLGKCHRLPPPLAKKFKEKLGGSRSCDENASNVSVKYPALLAMCGSGILLFKVYAGGQYEFLRTHALSGGSLLALSHLLAQTNSFSEVAELSKKGSDQELDIVLRDFNYYNEKLDGDYPHVFFGKVLGKERDEILQEDLVASIVSQHTFNISLIVQQMATIVGAKTVYFCGGLSTDQHIREQMWKYYSIHSQLDITGFESEAVFLRHGQYLGALGCLMKTLKQQ